MDSATSAQGQSLCSPRLLGCQEQDPEGGGQGIDIYIYIHTHIYIYNSDSLYKVGREKGEGGTLLGHHTDDVA